MSAADLPLSARFALAAVLIAVAWAGFGRGPRRRPWVVYAAGFAAVWLTGAGYGFATLMVEGELRWLPASVLGVFLTWPAVRGRWRGTRIPPATRALLGTAGLFLATAPALARADAVENGYYDLGEAAVTVLRGGDVWLYRQRFTEGLHGGDGRRRRGGPGDRRVAPPARTDRRRRAGSRRARRPGRRGRPMNADAEWAIYLGLRAPAILAGGFALAAAARRRQDDRATFRLLAVAGCLLLLTQAGDYPVEDPKSAAWGGRVVPAGGGAARLSGGRVGDAAAVAARDRRRVRRGRGAASVRSAGGRHPADRRGVPRVSPARPGASRLVGVAPVPRPRVSSAMNAPLAKPRRRPRAAPAPATDVRRFTEAEYLAYERSPARAQERKSELLAGGIVREVPNVRRAHDLLTVELIVTLHRFLDPDRHEVHTGDIKFRPRECRFYCPDVMVTPSPPAMYDEVGEVLLDPILVVEVLSPSTEATDRGEKQGCYRGTPSVLEYWLVAQDAVRVERQHRPGPAAPWETDIHDDRAAEVPLPALGGAVSVRALYRRALPEGSPGAGPHTEG